MLRIAPQIGSNRKHSRHNGGKRRVNITKINKALQKLTLLSRSLVLNEDIKMNKYVY